MIDPCFQGVNRLFVLSLQNNDDWTGHARYFIPTAEIRDYNVMIDGQNSFDQPVKLDIRTYADIWKITTGQGDDYKNHCLLDYLYFKEHYKMIAIDLSKQPALDPDPKVIKQINFTGNFFHKEPWEYCKFILLQYNINMTQ